MLRQLYAARMMPKIKIPVASISAKTANVLLNWTIDLADNANEIQITSDEFGLRSLSAQVVKE